MIVDFKVQKNWLKTEKGNLFVCSWENEEFQNKAPLILFHDSLGCVQLWRDFPEKLAKATQRNVIAYDRLGFGQSEIRYDEPNVSFISQEAEEVFPILIKTLNLNNFILFGHSVGGAMAIECASLFPDKCLALITESAQSFVEERTIEGILLAKKNFEKPSEIIKLEKYHGERALWVLKAWTDVWLSMGFSTWSLEKTLTKVISPILVIHGDKDEYGSMKFPLMISEGTSGESRMEILENCGHVPHREQPERV